MKRRTNLFPYIALASVILLFSLLAVGYASFSDTLQVNGSITLAIPTPAPTVPPSPPGVTISGTGYYYWSNQLFSGPNWSCFYQVKPSTNMEDHKNPASFWSGNVLTFTNNINILIPTNGVPGNKLLNDFRSKVRAAISYKNTSGQKLQFSQVSKSSGVNQNFVRLSDLNFKMDGKNVDLQNNDTMVISVFCEDNWAVANQYLDLERLPGKTHTEEKQVKFKVYNTQTHTNQEYIINFVLTITAVDALPMAASSPDTSLVNQMETDDGLMITTPEAETNFIVPMEMVTIPTTAPSSTEKNTPTMPDVSISESGYKENNNNTFSAPYWTYTYSNRTGQSIQNDADPVAYWDENALIIYNNVFIPNGGSPDEALLKSFNSNVGAALRFYNGTQDDLEFTPVSTSDSLSQSFTQVGRLIINSSKLTLLPGETGVISSYSKDSWRVGSNGLDLENLPGMTYLDDEEMTFHVTNLATNESRTYIIRFVLSLKTMAPTLTIAPTSQPTQLTTPAPIPTTTPTPTPAPVATESITTTSTPEQTPTPSPSMVTIDKNEPSPTSMPKSFAAPSIKSSQGKTDEGHPSPTPIPQAAEPTADAQSPAQ